MGWGKATRARRGTYQYVQLVNSPDNGGVPVLPLGLGCK
jgi:hypothetical protein